jgi:RecQ family ATP-dependent DNA helicase
MNLPTPQIDLTAQRELLKSRWGYDNFKPAQEDAIRHILGGFDVIAILQTGYGKSVIFQIAALSTPGCTIVISPLIALMKDQVDDCKKYGLEAGYLSSTMGDSEADSQLEKFSRGAYKLFYISPERMASPRFKKALERVIVNFIAVDEAHSISMQGNDFRPAYLQISTMVQSVSCGGSRPPIIAVSATATNAIIGDIVAKCGMNADYKRVIGDPIRNNLTYKVWAGGLIRNLSMLAPNLKVGHGRHIIYAGTRKNSEEVANILTSAAGSQLTSADVAFYHAGMDGQTRTRVQDEFKSGRLTVVVATCAFGMGIDIPDVRTVIHVGAPGSIESYVQEAGRAGRDGKASDVILLCDGAQDSSISMQKYFIERQTPPYEIFQDVWQWLHKNLQPNSVLALSAEDIAEDMSKSGYKSCIIRAGNSKPAYEAAVRHLGTQVGAALATMDGYQLLLRRPVEAGVIVRVDVAIFSSVLPDCTGMGARVGEYLKKQMDAFFLSERAWTEAAAGGRVSEMNFDKEDAAHECNMSTLNFDRALKAFAQTGAVVTSRGYSGKTTQILKYGENLSDILPRVWIEEKRKRAYDRLNAMIGYVEAKTRWRGDRTTDACYREYIRNYFQLEPT